MAIVRSFNKYNGVTYAYDVNYVWSEEAQKKVPVKKCVGKFDPETGLIVPNGRRGPKPKVSSKSEKISDENTSVIDGDAPTGDSDMQQLTHAVSEGFSKLNGTLTQLAEIMNQLKEVLPDS